MDNKIRQPIVKVKNIEVITQQNVEQETGLLFNGKKVYCIYKEFTNKNRGTYAITSGVETVVGFGGSGLLGAADFKGPWDLQSKDAYGNSWSFIVNNGTLNCKYVGSNNNWDGGSWKCWVLYTKV